MSYLDCYSSFLIMILPSIITAKIQIFIHRESLQSVQTPEKHKKDMIV